MELSWEMDMIRKMKLLLDEKYIINTANLFSLIKRYWINSAVFIGICCSYLAYVYLTQNQIFLRKTAFIGQSSTPVDPAIPGFFTGGSTNSSGVSLNSLRGIIDSWEFKANLAQKMVSDSDFTTLKFKVKNLILSGEDLNKECAGSTTCVFEKIESFLNNNIKIVKNSMTPGFTLRIHGIDEFTVKKVEVYTVELLNLNRVTDLSREVIKRAEMLNQMIDKKNNDFGDVEFDDLKEQLEINENHLNDIDKSIKEVQFMRNKEKGKLFEIGLKLKYFQDKGKQNGNEGDSVDLEKRTKLEKNLLKLQKNQEILKVNNDNNDNDVFIAQLGKKIEIIKRELKKYGGLKDHTQTFDNLQKNKNEIIPQLTIEKSVLMANVKKLEKELVELDVKRSIIVKNINQFKNKINEINPDYQLILDLKKQYNQTLIKSSTIVTDLQFENFRPQSEILKPHSLRKITVFTILTLIFIPLLVSLFRYIFERNIYTKEELENEFPDIEILGHSTKIAV